jgi:predicted TPR repeat methyltransferase
MRVRFAPVHDLFAFLARQGYSATAQAHGWAAVWEWVREQTLRLPTRRFSLLDLGCADGAIGALLVEDGFSGTFVGVDFSSSMLERCRAKNLYAMLIEQDLNDGLGVDRSLRFDLVTAIGVLEFVEDPAPLLVETREVLKPGGQLWVTFEPPEATISPWKFGRTADEGVRLLEAAGYRAVAVERRVGYRAVSLDVDSTLRSLGPEVELAFVRAEPK